MLPLPSNVEEIYYPSGKTHYLSGKNALPSSGEIELPQFYMDGCYTLLLASKLMRAESMRSAQHHFALGAPQPVLRFESDVLLLLTAGWCGLFSRDGCSVDNT